MARVIVFDVNETLLDLRALDPHFERLFGSAAVRREWFSQLLQNSFVSTITNTYTSFGTVGMAALDMVAARYGVSLVEEQKAAIRNAVTHLPPHPDVRASLYRLRGAGLRLFTLTNSITQVEEEQLTNAGLRDYFEAVFSAETVKRLKPACEPYQMVADTLGVPIDQVRHVAAHSWDIVGALNAGCAAAFVARPGAALDPLAPQPDVVGADLAEVAAGILARDVAYGA